jgi:hypothetical protein
MPAPEVSAFGDGSHAPGTTGITVDGGGFGAFPGSVWIYQNADLSGLADQLAVVSWNDIQLTVDIPGSLNNGAGTRYLFVQREDLAWSNALAFTLQALGSETGSRTDTAVAADARAATAQRQGSVSVVAAGVTTQAAQAARLGLAATPAVAADARTGTLSIIRAVLAAAVAQDSCSAATSSDVSIVGARAALTETFGMQSAVLNETSGMRATLA